MAICTGQRKPGWHWRTPRFPHCSAAARRKLVGAPDLQSKHAAQRRSHRSQARAARRRSVRLCCRSARAWANRPRWGLSRCRLAGKHHRRCLAAVAKAEQHPTAQGDRRAVSAGCALNLAASPGQGNERACAQSRTPSESGCACRPPRLPKRRQGWCDGAAGIGRVRRVAVCSLSLAWVVRLLQLVLRLCVDTRSI